MLKTMVSILATFVAAFFFFVANLASSDQPPMVRMSDIGTALTGGDAIVISSLEHAVRDTQ